MVHMGYKTNTSHYTLISKGYLQSLVELNRGQPETGTGFWSWGNRNVLTTKPRRLPCHLPRCLCSTFNNAWLVKLKKVRLFYFSSLGPTVALAWKFCHLPRTSPNYSPGISTRPVREEVRKKEVGLLFTFPLKSYFLEAMLIIFQSFFGCILRIRCAALSPKVICLCLRDPHLPWAFALFSQDTWKNLPIIKLFGNMFYAQGNKMRLKNQIWHSLKTSFVKLSLNSLVLVNLLLSLHILP